MDCLKQAKNDITEVAAHKSFFKKKSQKERDDGDWLKDSLSKKGQRNRKIKKE